MGIQACKYVYITFLSSFTNVILNFFFNISYIHIYTSKQVTTDWIMIRNLKFCFVHQFLCFMFLAFPLFPKMLLFTLKIVLNNNLKHMKQ